MRVLPLNEGLAVLEGRAMRYGEPGDVGPFTEEIRPGAFEMSDVIANRQHVREKPLGRTGGGGLTLTDSETELRVRLELPDTVDGRDTMTLVRQKILRGLSVEMAVRNDQWLGKHRVVHRAVLLGVAVVDRAAYAGATIAEGRQWQAAEFLGTYRPRGKRRWRSL